MMNTFIIKLKYQSIFGVGEVQTLDFLFDYKKFYQLI